MEIVELYENFMGNHFSSSQPFSDTVMILSNSSNNGHKNEFFKFYLLVTMEHGNKPIKRQLFPKKAARTNEHFI